MKRERTIAPKRNKPSPDLILCSDFHLREPEHNPVCRVDSYWEAQWRKLEFIKQLQQIEDCPVVHAGDLFDHWKPSPELLAHTMECLPGRFLTVYGQHDLPQHNLQLQYKTGIYALEKAGKLQILPECSWGQEPKTGSLIFPNQYERTILVWHYFNYQGEAPNFGGKHVQSGASLLRKYPQFDLILTGDNHKPFVEEYKGRILVNPGSLLRSTAAQKKHQPRIYYYWAETNDVEPIFLPIEKDVVVDDHLTVEKERNERITAFISSFQNGTLSEDLSFEDNLSDFISKNDIPEPVIQQIYKAIEKRKK